MILDNGPPKEYFGAQPKGYLILTREGRMAAILTSDTRTAAKTDPERAELFKSMVAYSGKYRIEGMDFITTVDASWNEAWNGTEQRRHYRLEGDKLFIESAPLRSALFDNKTVVGRLVWERER
jgi:hypothetical protein